MRADWPEDGEQPPDEHPDRRDDRDDTSDQAIPAGNPQAETRTRQEAYSDLRISVAKEESSAAKQVTAEEQAAAEKWQADVSKSRWMWSEYQRRWPPGERQQVDRSKDSSGDGEGPLTVEQNDRFEVAYSQIAGRERDKISPALSAIESQDSDRQLVGVEHRLKDRDRLKEKISGMIKESGFSPENAMSNVPDAIRGTFAYQEHCYTKGVLADIDRLKGEGFILHALRNYWSSDQYKGINSQWIEPETGQRFEVQFHTHISYEAKQLTHTAYGRLRTNQADEFEELVLEAFQKKVAADVPVPPGAVDIPDYRERSTHAG